MTLPHAIDPTAPTRPWRPALAWAVGLSVAFFLIYGGCNALTAVRGDVGRAAFAWERHTPFVPAMILPYLSIDLFFVAAPFLCRTRGELRNHGRRVIVAIVAAAACFLLFPLEAVHVRPADVGGWAGPLFRWFWAMDKPYNLAPSLHIALRTLLWVIYVRHTTGLLRASLKVWFVLIGVSTLLTYQHHVIDVLTGYALGAMCLAIVPDAVPNGPRPRRWDVAGRYAAAAGACLLVGWPLRPWGVAMVWPAFALAAVAAVYAGVGPAAFGKRPDGRVPLAARAFFLPYTLPARAWQAWLGRGGPPARQVMPGLIVGRRPTAAGARDLVAGGVGAVVDLAGEYVAPTALARLPYFSVPMLDLVRPTREQVDTACDFILARVDRGDAVYVHCAMGRSRAALVAAAALIRAGRVDGPDDAIRQLTRAGCRIVLAPAAVELLEDVTRRRDVTIAAMDSTSPGAVSRLVWRGAMPGPPYASAAAEAAPANDGARDVAT